MTLKEFCEYTAKAINDIWEEIEKLKDQVEDLQKKMNEGSKK